MFFPLSGRSRFSRARASRAGFMLMEIMLAVAIFSISVIALGRCMSECIDTQTFCVRQSKALLALQNRMVEVQASPVMPETSAKHPLKGMFSGMTMIERRRTLDIKNDDNTNLSNLQEVTLTVEWPESGGRTQSSALSFIILRGAQ